MENVLSSIVEAIIPFLQDSVSDECMLLYAVCFVESCSFAKSS